VILDLQVDKSNHVPRAPRRLCDKFEAERLEPEEYFRIEKWAGMDAEKPHENSLLRRSFAWSAHWGEA